MTETTEATAERFHFVNLDDVMTILAFVRSGMEAMKDNVEQELMTAARAFGTPEYETAFAAASEGLTVFHGALSLYDDLAKYALAKWNWSPHRGQSTNNGVPAGLVAYLKAQGVDVQVITIPPSEDGTPSSYPFGERPEVADGNDPDAPVHGEYDETGDTPTGNL